LFLLGFLLFLLFRNVHITFDHKALKTDREGLATRDEFTHQIGKLIGNSVDVGGHWPGRRWTLRCAVCEARRNGKKERDNRLCCEVLRDLLGNLPAELLQRLPAASEKLDQSVDGTGVKFDDGY